MLESTPELDQLLDTRAAAHILGLSPRTLERWRTTASQAAGPRRGPPWLQVSNATATAPPVVRYRLAELVAWVADRNESYAAEVESRLPQVAGLLSRAEILARAGDFPCISGVYFLLQGDAIVYIGKAADIWGAVGAQRGRLSFDRWTYVEATGAALDRLERAYIDALLPPANRDRETALRRRLRAAAVMQHYDKTA